MVFAGFLCLALIIIIILMQEFNFESVISGSSAEVYSTNLREGGNIRIEIKIESIDKDLQEITKSQQREIRDTVLSMVRDISKDELKGPNNLYKLKRNLIKELDYLLNVNEKYKISISEVITY